MGTPVIDSTLGADGFPTIYVCGPGSSTGGVQDRYELHAISAKDGTERTGGWPAKLDATVKATNDGLTRAFNPTIEAQRPALSLVNGIVYIGFGGPFGDFGATYYGWVIAVDSTDPTKIGAWSTRGGGGAIWSPGGFSSDGDGVLITTGNNYGTTPATYSDSEGIIRLSGLALTKKDFYFPTRYKQMDTDDQDMSSSSVLLLNVPGATPANYAITESKDAHLYVLDASKLGAATGDGYVVDMQLTTTVTNHSARTSPVSYTTPDGAIHIAITVDRGPYTPAMCPATPVVDSNTAILMGLTVTPSPFKVTTSWCTNIGGPVSQDAGTVRNRSASPLVTTIDGKANRSYGSQGACRKPNPPLGPRTIRRQTFSTASTARRARSSTRAATARGFVSGRPRSPSKGTSSSAATPSFARGLRSPRQNAEAFVAGGLPLIELTLRTEAAGGARERAAPG